MRLVKDLVQSYLVGNSLILVTIAMNGTSYVRVFLSLND